MIIPTYEVPVDDERYADGDFTLSASRLGTTVSSVSWAVEAGTSASVSGTPVLIGAVSQALIVASPTVTGITTFKVRATMADGQIVSEYIKVDVVDPA
jgi:hypothetical protein